MLIVTDSGMDMADVTREQFKDLLHVTPLMITLAGKTYQSRVDIHPDEFYKLLEASGEFPTTSQPSPGDFADLYTRVAAQDPNILSIHISSGLSGTLNSAKLGAGMVNGAAITHYDTRTLSGAEGWHVEAAARAIRAGWDKDRIIALLEQVSANTDTMYTLSTLKYLVHGGRISHMRGLLGSILDIKPLIGVNKADGKYEERGKARTLGKAVLMLADLIAKRHPAGSRLRVQVLHANNLADAEKLKARIDGMFDCTWVPTGSIDPALGAHTGSGLVGVVYAPQSLFDALP
jgi:DegV family protein with EDD domain